MDYPESEGLMANPFQLLFGDLVPKHSSPFAELPPAYGTFDYRYLMFLIVGEIRLWVLPFVALLLEQQS